MRMSKLHAKKKGNLRGKGKRTGSAFIHINVLDNVVTVLEDIDAGAVICLKVGNETSSIKVKNFIPFGHKFTIEKIEKGAHVIKYGESIGKAIREIAVGEHVHVHNTDSIRGIARRHKPN